MLSTCRAFWSEICRYVLAGVTKLLSHTAHSNHTLHHLTTLFPTPPRHAGWCTLAMREGASGGRDYRVLDTVGSNQILILSIKPINVLQSRPKSHMDNYNSCCFHFVSICYWNTGRTRPEGILLHKSGELRSAQASLKLKAMRAFFGLKRTIIRSKITFKAAATLFDSLIKTNCFIWRTNVHSDESHCQNYS